MHWNHGFKSGALVAIALLSAIALVACTQAAPPEVSAPAAGVASPAVAAKPASIPGLQIIAPAEGDSVEPGAKVKPGYKVLMTGESIISVEETRTLDALRQTAPTSYSPSMLRAQTRSHESRASALVAKSPSLSTALSCKPPRSRVRSRTESSS